MQLSASSFFLDPNAAALGASAPQVPATGPAPANGDIVPCGEFGALLAARSNAMVGGGVAAEPGPTALTLNLATRSQPTNDGGVALVEVPRTSGTGVTAPSFGFTGSTPVSAKAQPSTPVTDAETVVGSSAGGNGAHAGSLRFLRSQSAPIGVAPVSPVTAAPAPRQLRGPLNLSQPPGPTLSSEPDASIGPGQPISSASVPDASVASQVQTSEEMAAAWLAANLSTPATSAPARELADLNVSLLSDACAAGNAVIADTPTQSLAARRAPSAGEPVAGGAGISAQPLATRRLPSASELGAGIEATPTQLGAARQAPTSAGEPGAGAAATPSRAASIGAESARSLVTSPVRTAAGAVVAPLMAGATANPHPVSQPHVNADPRREFTVQPQADAVPVDAKAEPSLGAKTAVPIAPTALESAVSSRVSNASAVQSDLREHAPIVATMRPTPETPVQDSNAALAAGFADVQSKESRNIPTAVSAADGPVRSSFSAVPTAPSIAPAASQPGVTGDSALPQPVVDARVRTSMPATGPFLRASGPAEKIAGPENERRAAPAIAKSAELKNTLVTAEERVEGHSATVGINVAKSESPMPAFAQPVQTPIAENDSNSFAPAPLSFDALVKETAQPDELASSAQRAVDSVMSVVDRVAHGAQRGVKLQFSVSGVDLAVRVELRQDGVHTTFVTDSPDLRAALAQEWNTVVAMQTTDRPQRLADPVFTSTSSGNHFAGDRGASHQRESGTSQNQWEKPASSAPSTPHSARAAVPSSSPTPANPRPMPHLTARHLHTFA